MLAKKDSKLKFEEYEIGFKIENESTQRRQIPAERLWLN
ncbi:hypothetical protein NUZ5A_51108 [Candidatus Nitrosotenuis uzonensis]|uniref:Uncharacterized protein n=1 Tax=Candidatus Nitrosotenuis uzonensis TaxID=1407055 RepID=A0A812F3Y6_9ARCH|nr:hypothetical protein NUZ5A_51108 [Candidatus Nitrosotenuis uzonensis]